MQCDDWDTRRIYELPPSELLGDAPFFAAFGQFHDINGHTLEVIRTRPKSALLTASLQGTGQEGLTLADTVLIMKTADVQGITAGESLRLDGQLYRVLTVSYPLRSVVRLDLQGIES